MSEKELKEQYDNNELRINKIAKELQHLASPIDKCNHNKEKCEKFSNAITSILSRIMISTILLILFPHILFKIVGLTIISGFAVAGVILATLKIRNNKEFKACSGNVQLYNDKFLEQYKLLKQQEEIKSQLAEINSKTETEKQPSMISRLSSKHLNRPKLQHLNVAPYKVEHKKHEFSPINTETTLTDEDIYTPVNL